MVLIGDLMIDEDYYGDYPKCITIPPDVIIQRMTLKSHLYGFFGPHAVSDLFTDYQLFTISRDGTVSVVCKSEYGPKPTEVESLRCKIKETLASAIIDQSVLILENSPNVSLVCDGPSWSLSLKDTNGKRYFSQGCMWADPEYNNQKLSEYIRERLSFGLSDREYSIIDLSKLALFDGIKDEKEPNERGLHLIDLSVAGVQYAIGLEHTKDIESGEPVRLIREPDNPYDDKAIAIYCKGDRIGYVPKNNNAIFANLIDGKKRLYGEIKGTNNSQIWVSFYLKEGSLDDYPEEEFISNEELEEEKKRDIFRGCLVCGAYGDALGAPIEFLSDTELKRKYQNAEHLEPILKDGVMRFSDDTQMTLLNVNSMICRETRLLSYGIAAEHYHYAYRSYRCWALIMNNRPIPEGCESNSWILKIPEICAKRAPGLTCMGQLLEHEECGTLERRPNNSKGCGGVMRAAPYGLVMKPEYAIELACEDAVTTHGHDLGWLTAGAFAGIINRISKNSDSLIVAIRYVMNTMGADYEKYDGWSDLSSILTKVISEYENYLCKQQFDITKFGEGWVAEEALAMALYTCLCFENDIPAIMKNSVFHGGDSDSVGSIAGNICGAMYGYKRICESLDVTKLERLDVILKLADDLVTDYDEGCDWHDVYTKGNVPGDIL